jgi:hypothetical protein
MTTSTAAAGTQCLQTSCATNNNTEGWSVALLHKIRQGAVNFTVALAGLTCSTAQHSTAQDNTASKPQDIAIFASAVGSDHESEKLLQIPAAVPDTTKSCSSLSHGRQDTNRAAGHNIEKAVKAALQAQQQSECSGLNDKRGNLSQHPAAAHLLCTTAAAGDAAAAHHMALSDACCMHKQAQPQRTLRGTAIQSTQH